jgi:hypothetical protein
MHCCTWCYLGASVHFWIRHTLQSLMHQCRQLSAKNTCYLLAGRLNEIPRVECSRHPTTHQMSTSLLLARFSSLVKCVCNLKCITTILPAQQRRRRKFLGCWKSASFLHTETDTDTHTNILATRSTRRVEHEIFYDFFRKRRHFFAFNFLYALQERRYTFSTTAALLFYFIKSFATLIACAWVYTHARRLSYPEQGNTVKHRELQIYGAGKRHAE